MNNVEIMRKFFYNLPEKLSKDGLTEKMINSWNSEQYLEFVKSLKMDYPTKELQQQFEENKKAWILAIQFNSSGGKILFG